jgi:PAS domain S-box-containing protein
MTSPLRQLDVTVVGEREIAAPLAEVSGPACPALSVSTVTTERLPAQLDESDCLVVDCQTAEESWYSLVDHVTDVRPTLPVVVLVAEESVTTVSGAFRADVTEHFPRSLCKRQPTLVASRIASLVDWTDDREFEQMYRELFESVSDGLVVHEPDTGEIRDCNGQFCELTGYSQTELVGETIDLITAPDEAYSYEGAKEHIKRAQTEGPQLFEWHNQRRDGDTFYSEVHLDVMQMYGNEYVLASVRDITERKRRQREFEQIFHGVQDAITVLDPETLDILEANDAYLDMLGYEDVETLRQQGIDGLSVTREGYTLEEGKDIHRRVAETGEPELVEWRAETRTGAERFLEVKVAPAIIGGEAVNIAIHRDITERKRRERDFEQIFHGVNDIVAVHHPETGDLVKANDTLLEITGHDRETLFDIGAEGLTVPSEEFTPDQVSSLIDRVMNGEDIDPYEQAIETADGDVRWLEVNPTRAVIDGEPRFLAIGRDITERRERQQRLEIERDRRAALFEDNPDPVLRLEFVDRQPIIREVNPAFERVFGLDGDRVVGSTVGDALVPETEREQYEQFRKQVADGQTIEREAQRQTANGLRQFVFKVIQLDMADEAATDAYVWYTDVTERRRRERAIRSLQDATARMQRASTVAEIAEIATESAEDALELSETICWLHDERTGSLEPAATTGVNLDSVTALTPGHDWHEVFESREAVLYTSDRAETALPLDSALLLPLGDHGLLAAGRPDDSAHDDVTLDVARTLSEQTSTALERVKRGREVRHNERRLQAIIDRIDEAIFLAPLVELTEGVPAPDFVSSGYEDIWGQSLETVHERYDEGFFGTLHPDDADGYRRLLDGIIDDVEENCADERYTKEYRIERPTGEVRWVQSDFYPTTWDDDTARIVIVSRDITERKERDRTIESFHDATAELTTADTVGAASEVAVEAGAEVFDIPATAVYHYDADTATLEPTATGPAMPDPGNLPSLSADDTVAWETFVGEQLQRVDTDEVLKSASSPSSEVLLVPLGGNGILGVWVPDGQFDTDAASILAATLEASLNRLRGERQLETRRQELQAQTERARRLDAVAELTQRVEAAITTNSSQRGVQESVCSELVDVEPFVGAFISVAEVGTDQLTPRTVAGIDSDHVEQALQLADQPDQHPATEAWQRGESRVINDLVGAGRRSEWRQRLLKDGAGAVCAVPLTYNGVTHGVLTVVASEPGEFGDREVDVLSQLGTSIGYAITAVERQRALESDDTLELEFEGQETDIKFARLADELECQVRHERTVRRQDGSVRVFYTVLDDTDETVTAANQILPGDVTVVSRQDGQTLFERQGSSWFGSLLSEYGGVLRRGYATAAGVTLVVELPHETDTRTIVERLQAAYPSLNLSAQRQHRDTESTTGEVRSHLQQRLSDRQYEALETAYAMGYFEWPRESSGEDVADRLGITQPTVNKHIRLGEGKVFDLLFDGE